MSDNLTTDLTGVPAERYGGRHSDHLLEQYKLYVEMADRISQRRQTASTFFLTINTALVALLGIALPRTVDALSTIWYVIVSIAGILLCYAWYRLIRSYSKLNAAKFRVVEEIEKMLPIRPYDAEWRSVGRGRDPRRYQPFTTIEPWVPVIFGVLYLALMVSSIAAIGR